MAATPKGDLRANSVPWSMVEAVAEAAGKDNTSVRAWIIEAVEEKLEYSWVALRHPHMRLMRLRLQARDPLMASRKEGEVTHTPLPRPAPPSQRPRA